MPKSLAARLPLDSTEERHVRTLAHSAHAPADWVFHTQMILRSWKGLRTRQVAEALHCHGQTVREQLHAFNARTSTGWG